MSDLSRHLPLSQRPKRDETGVSSHWGGEIGVVLGSLVAGLGAADQDAWHTPALRRDLTVRSTAAAIVDRLTVSARQRMTTRAFGLAEHLFNRSATDADLAERAAEHTTPTALVASLTQLAEEASVGRGRVGIRELEAAVIGGLDIAIPLGFDLAIPASASGAVALRRALSAPVEIKAVIRGHSLAATDADWSFGRGPELVDSAVGLLLFLYGRSNTPPRRRRIPPAGDA